MFRLKASSLFSGTGESVSGAVLCTSGDSVSAGVGAASGVMASGPEVSVSTASGCSAGAVSLFCFSYVRTAALILHLKQELSLIL